jgi:5-methylcytosine-specific restriction endonuclease McrA
MLTELNMMSKNIIQRQSTLMNEYSKCLGCLPFEEKPSNKEMNLRKTLLKLNGICEYCEKKPATTVDHFFPLVKDGLPTNACNDFWNLVDVCKDCNSSKGNRTIEEWKIAALNPNSKSKSNPFKTARSEYLYKKLTTYQKFADKFRYRKTIDVSKQQKYKQLIASHLQQLQSIANKTYEKTKFVKGGGKRTCKN